MNQLNFNNHIESLLTKFSDQLKKEFSYIDFDIFNNNIEYFDIDDSKTNDILFINNLNESQLISNNSNININIDDNILTFELDKYILNIYESYKKDDNKIISQFDLDFPRSELVINNNKIKNKKDVFNNFYGIINHNIKIFDVNMQLYLLLIMICTQASFAFPFILINKLYSNLSENKFVVSNKSKYIINIDKQNINIKLSSIFVIKNTLTNKSESFLDVLTTFDIFNNNNSYQLSKYGIISWQIY